MLSPSLHAAPHLLAAPPWRALPHTAYPAWYCRQRNRTETLGSPVGPQLAVGQMESQTFRAYFFIHITSGLKENITESFLLKKLYDAMNEDK